MPDKQAEVRETLTGADPRGWYECLFKDSAVSTCHWWTGSVLRKYRGDEEPEYQLDAYAGFLGPLVATPTPKCRRCSDCEGASHHWLPNGNFGNDPSNPHDEEDYNVQATHLCKHCPVFGMECEACQGEGCDSCEHEGVVLLAAKAAEVVGAGGEASDPDSATARLAAIREKLNAIVITKGEDAGVVLLSADGPTHYDPAMQCEVYDLDYLSPLGDALMELWELTTLDSTPPPAEQGAVQTSERT